MRGHIRKRSKKSWTIWIDLGRDATGKRRQKTITVQGAKRDAERELAKILDQLHKGAYVEPSTMLVREFLEKWLAHAATRVSAKTHERYKELIDAHVVPELGTYKIGQLRPLHFQSLYTDLLATGRRDGKGGLSAQTVVHVHRVVRTAFHQALRWQLLAVNPIDAVEPPRPKKREMLALDETQTARLLHLTEGTRLYMPVLLAVSLGMRRGELLGLRWTDIDLERGELSILRTLEQTRCGLNFKEPKTDNARRKITLPPMTIEALQSHRADQAEQRLLLGPAYEDHGLVLAREDGVPWSPNKLSAAFGKVVRSQNIPQVRFHDLRHSHATQLLKQGIHPKIVSERLGHSSISITLDLYSHVLPGMQRDAALGFDRALQQAINEENENETGA